MFPHPWLNQSASLSTARSCAPPIFQGYSGISLLRILLFALATAGWLGSTPSQADPSPPAPREVLTNAAQVLRLTAAEAAQGRPVHLRGVVVDESQPRERALILLDQSASIYVSAATNLFAPYHNKYLLDIHGVTSAGEYAPCVIATAARSLGMTVVPPPRRVTYQELITGALDAQYVQLTGVVRQCWPAQTNDTTWRIELAADGGTLPVRIPLPQDPQIQVDAEVTIQAVCLYEFNQRRQALSPVLQVPEGGTVGLRREAPADPYAAPVHTAVSLLQYSPDIPFGHRVHVRGVVTSSQPGSLVWIRDETSGLRLQIQQTEDWQPGDQIEALGFPGYGSSTPVLEDAIGRKINSGTPPAALLLANANDAYAHQDDLVSISGRLRDLQPVLNGLELTLEQNKTLFKAVLRPPLSGSQPLAAPAWPPGSLVRVSGICDVIYDETKPVMGIWHPQTFQILLRSPEDVTVLQWPSWWTTVHVMFLLGAVAALSLLVSGGVLWGVRRRLAEQVRRRTMAETEFSAILSERNRLAREIHDTLAQGLTATSVQLQLAKIHAAGDSPSVGRYLDQALQMVRDCLEEARNSIWNMRPQVLETGDLTGALKNILQQLSDGVIADTRFEVTGRERRLSAVIETNVLRLGQEAVTNAVKHARATRVLMRLEFGEKHFTLTVSDDGRGFDPASPPPSEGGFGLVGMQERAQALNGQLTVRSAPREGTEISLRIPLLGE